MKYYCFMNKTSLCMMFSLQYSKLQWESILPLQASRDTQAFWRSLTLYMRTSTRADIAIEDLLGQITSKRLTTI